MEQRRSDSAGDVHPADRIAERRDPLRQSSSELRRGQCVPDAAACPERGAVEAAGVALGALVAVCAAAGVDDVRVGRADVLDVELVLLPLRRQVVGQEDVGGLGDLVEHLLAPGRGDVDADAALAAVGVLDQRMAVGVELEPAHVDEAALGVAAHWVLDLDDVGAPVGEYRAGRGHEGELRYLEDANALHHLDQVDPLLTTMSSGCQGASLAEIHTVMFTVELPRNSAHGGAGE